MATTNSVDIDVVSRTQGGISTETNVQSIRNEIGQYLQINNMNFLIGAGCSSNIVEDETGNLLETGIPGMAQLFEGFCKENVNFDIAGKQIVGEFDSNLEKMLESMGSIQITNDIFQVDDAISDKITAVKRFLFKEIKNGHDSPQVLDLYKSFYMRISGPNRKTPINVFTTNYDLFNEKALDDLRFPYNNGFSGTYSRKFNPASYRYTFVESINLSTDVWEQIPHFFSLYKLHGSISWKKSGLEVLEVNPNTITEDDAVMIYPTPMKDRSTLMTPYSDLFRAMENAISKPNSVLITMGYSFGDDHINRLITNALAVPSFKLIVFGLGDNIKKLNTLKDRRIIIINSPGKIHYFKNIIEKVLPSIAEETIESIEDQERADSAKLLFCD